jgi:hypothetical protein
MYYINYTVVINAFKKLIIERTHKIDNGIVGILFLMKNSNTFEEISGSKRIPFDEKRVENDINHLFAFQDYIPAPLNPNTFFILSENFENEIFLNLKKDKVDLLSLAIVCLQSTEFKFDLSNEELINYFIKEFKLPTCFVNTCFKRDLTSIDVSYASIQTPVNKRQNEVKKIIPNTTSNTTLVFEGKWLKSLGGSFGQGAYTQKLTATSGLKELVFVPSGSLQSTLSYQGKATKTPINPFAMNVLYFGPSGTGKSTEARRELEQDKGVDDANLTQVTFHPEYTYSDFVGSLKPITLFKTLEGSSVFDSIYDAKAKYTDFEPVVEFKFEAGPFVEACIKAANSDISEPHALIIDEINRGNVPEIMGDIFQLLDREKTNRSNSNSELQKYIKEHCQTDIFDHGLVIPSNLYIYATINPADQNVYPLDTAFKRRWKRRYWKINSDHASCSKWNLLICGQSVPWPKFLDLINEYITHKLSLSEDKQLGQFFIKFSDNPTQNEVKEETLKVISYLWEDIPKSKRNQVFGSGIFSFSEIHDVLLSDASISKLFAVNIADKLIDILEQIGTETVTEESSVES